MSNITCEALRARRGDVSEYTWTGITFVSNVTCEALCSRRGDVAEYTWTSITFMSNCRFDTVRTFEKA